MDLATLLGSSGDLNRDHRGVPADEAAVLVHYSVFLLHSLVVNILPNVLQHF